MTQKPRMENVKPAKTRQHIPAPPVGEEAGVNNMPVQVALTVPSTRGSEAISKEHFKKRIEFTRKWFDSRFGGDTTIRGSGGYVMDDELIEESVAIVESSMSVDSYLEHYEEFGEFIKERRRNWEQDTIAYRVEERVFIYPSRDYIDNDETVPSGLIRVV